MGSAPSIVQGAMPGDFPVNGSTVRVSLSESARKQDSSLPIFRIPPEILMLIFSLLPEPPYKEDDSWSDIPACITVSQVCQYWRHIAHHCPELWTVLPLQTRAWTERALERSEPCSFSFHVFPKTDRPWSREAGTLALKHLSRARNVVIGHQAIADPNPVALSIKLLEQHAAPLLESLVIVYGVLGHKVFLGETPTRLRRLVAYKTWMASDAPVFKASLTVLELDDCSLMNHNVSGLVDVLRLLPSLQRLVLSEASDSLLPRLPNAPKVELPHLSHMQVTDTTPKMVAIVDWLATPASATTILHVSSSQSASNTADAEMLATAYTSAHPTALPHAFRMLTISRLDPLPIQPPTLTNAAQFDDAPARLPLLALSLVSEDEGMPPLLSFALAWPDELMEPACMFFLAVLQPLIHGIPTLTIDHPSLSSPLFWLRLDEHCPHLPTLAFTPRSDLSAHAFVEEIYSCPNLYSNLTRLILDGVDLAYTGTRSGMSTFEHLHKALLKKKGMEPRMVLVLKACDVTREMIRLLEACLGESGLEWDRQESGFGH